MQSITEGLATSSLNFEDGFDEDNLPYVAKELPDHACKYCGIHSPASVVRCAAFHCLLALKASIGVTSLPVRSGFATAAEIPLDPI